MAEPSSQILACWVKDFIDSENWTPLSDVLIRATEKQLNKMSSDQRADLIEKRLFHIAEHLRNDRARMREDGLVPAFDIDNEERPYVKRTVDIYPKLLDKLRKIDPFKFEEVCAWILNKLGANSEATKKSNDGGVDFQAIDFHFVPDELPTPAACRAAVIGQAKRYKENNAISENELRKFIGGGLRRRHDLIREQKIKPLSPVIYAFWTTSSFDQNALSFARTMGLWYVEGVTLAKYCNELDLEEQIMTLPDY